MIEADKLCPAAQEALARFPVRKSPAQKRAFREWLAPALQAAGWEVHEEHSGKWIQTDNVVAGDVKNAQLVLTAHYDTPARLPFPNFIAPRNLPVSLLYQLLVAGGFYALVFFTGLAVSLLGGGPLLLLLVILLLSFGFVWLLLCGPANPSNANDNTSGTLALLEAACALPPQARAGVALVFFDNEEKGLFGSAAFKKRHGALADTLLLNFDCVGNGDTFLFRLPRASRRDKELARRLAAAFPPQGGKRALPDASPFTLYPSDQVHFRRGVGVAAMCRAPLVGYYVPRLHTPRDVVLQQENLLFLRDGCLRLVQEMTEADANGAAAPADKA